MNTNNNDNKAEVEAAVSPPPFTTAEFKDRIASLLGVQPRVKGPCVRKPNDNPGSFPPPPHDFHARENEPTVCRVCGKFQSHHTDKEFQEAMKKDQEWVSIMEHEAEHSDG